MSTNPPSRDPFQQQRKASRVLECEFQGESVPMILRHEDVRQAAKDFHTYSSNAPFRVPIPSEENVRSMRQLPIETDPPEHTDYRKIVEPFFQRAKDPSVIASVEKLIDELLVDALKRDSIEIVREFALPLQSRAFTYLLNVPEAEAQTWIGWGTHVFRDTKAAAAKGEGLEPYLHKQFDHATAHPGNDFFSALTQATYRGKPLTREEMMGFANLAFAGGRDTVIYSITSALAYLASNPKALEYLRQDTSRITLASEELFRVFMPLTHIGRVCPVDTNVHGVEVKAGGRVSLSWASANRDEQVFEAPEEVRLDRRPNPHLSFGFGTHLCLGAPHARLILRTLLQKCCERVRTLEALKVQEHVERTAAYERVIGHERLVMKLNPL